MKAPEFCSRPTARRVQGDLAAGPPGRCHAVTGLDTCDGVLVHREADLATPAAEDCGPPAPMRAANDPRRDTQDIADCLKTPTGVLCFMGSSSVRGASSGRRNETETAAKVTP